MRSRHESGTPGGKQQGADLERAILRRHGHRHQPRLMEIERRLRELGLELPEPRPSDHFSQGEVVGNLLFTSAHTGGPVRGGRMLTGQIGSELSFEEGAEACRTVLLLVLARVKAVLDDLDRIARIVKLTGYVACAPGFYEASQVMHAASELVHQLWGPRGRHARTVVTVSQLSANFPVEMDMIAEITPPLG